MRTISDTIARLAALKARAATTLEPSGDSRLEELPSFGSNPGSLVARTYVPDNLAPGAPLVVVLHGCTQTAAAYDRGSGWSKLAEREGFAVLFAEQQRSNNANLCFNWFVPADTQRDSGEVLSIRQMIETVASAHGIDQTRIFVTGLSAGGAMAGAMLAAYPDVFAGGAIIAGLPYGSATTVPEAFDRMRGHGGPTVPTLKAKLAAASSHDGPWPTLSVWHGTDDRTVAPSNADAIVAQWRDAHGIAEVQTTTDAVGGHRRRVWRDATGREVVESFTIAGMGHGTPLDAKDQDPLGQAGPFMLDAGISSTLHIARFWGIAAEAKARSRASRPVAAVGSQPLGGEILPPEKAAGRRAKSTTLGASRPAPWSPDAPTSIGAVIENALRAAGLMR